MKTLHFVSIFFLLIHLGTKAQNLPEPMNPPRLVNDYVGVFSKQENANIEKTLRDYNDSTSTQIYIVAVSDLQGYDPSDYASQLGEKWKIGKKDKNNGVIILIKPKIGNEKGEIFISVGYGLEEKLTDARIGRIIDQYMIPSLKENDYYTATNLAIQAISQYLSGQFQNEDNENESISWFEIIFIFTVFIIVIYLASKNKNNSDSGNNGRGFYPPVRGFGGKRSSGGGFGGNFSGGGGGSFGGGGAGRSW